MKLLGMGAIPLAMIFTILETQWLYGMKVPTTILDFSLSILKLILVSHSCGIKTITEHILGICCEYCYIFLLNFCRTQFFFVRPLMPMFWSSGDFCPGFQSQGGSFLRGNIQVLRS